MAETMRDDQQNLCDRVGRDCDGTGTEEHGDDVDEGLPRKFTDPWYHKPGFVYFISAGSDCEACKSIKIGVTIREGLLRRLRSIQSSNHTRIRLVRLIKFSTMRDAEIKENELHAKFLDSAHIPHGSVGYEWFTATTKLMDFIKSDCAKPEQVLRDDENKDLEAITRLFVDQSF